MALSDLSVSAWGYSPVRPMVNTPLTSENTMSFRDQKPKIPHRTRFSGLWLSTWLRILKYLPPSAYTKDGIYQDGRRGLISSDSDTAVFGCIMSGTMSDDRRTTWRRNDRARFTNGTLKHSNRPHNNLNRRTATTPFRTDFFVPRWSITRNCWPGRPCPPRVSRKSSRMSPENMGRF